MLSECTNNEAISVRLFYSLFHCMVTLIAFVYNLILNMFISQGTKLLKCRRHEKTFCFHHQNTFCSRAHFEGSNILPKTQFASSQQKHKSFERQYLTPRHQLSLNMNWAKIWIFVFLEKKDMNNNGIRLKRNEFNVLCR